MQHFAHRLLGSLTVPLCHVRLDRMAGGGPFETLTQGLWFQGIYASLGVFIYNAMHVYMSTHTHTLEQQREVDDASRISKNEISVHERQTANSVRK